jgi:hypothetical protein
MVGWKCEQTFLGFAGGEATPSEREKEVSGVRHSRRGVSWQELRGEVSVKRASGVALGAKKMN